MHAIPEHLLDRAVNIAVVGCGGTGSAIASGLPYLHQAMLAARHPGGLQVELIDGDTVSETNCVRQPFSRREIGLNKAVVLATRANMFWNLNWEGTAALVTAKSKLDADIIIGCVDTRAARKAIGEVVARGRFANYWLDCGNNATSGQFVLGSPTTVVDKSIPGQRLPTVLERYPELANAGLDAGDGPSCSAIEALDKQEPFVNQVIANHALALLARLFRYGQVEYCGGFVNLATGQVRAIPC